MARSIGLDNILPMKLAAACTILLAGCVAFPESDQEGTSMLVGTWYGEMRCGQDCGERDFLRWTRVNLPDGTQKVHFRYYWKGAATSNVLRTGRWGYEKGTYWLTCETFVVDGRAEPCPRPRYDFAVESLSRERMAYRHEELRVRYRAVRVADDFELRD
jgi:hypothetical protein